MSVFKIAFRRETLMPMLALLFGTTVCLGLVGTRIARTGNIRYGFLVWNLFLAWIPLVFALMASRDFGAGARQNWRWFLFGSAWLLFFPNAPYMFTDLIHLPMSFYRHYWVDLVLILSCAFTGLVVGFVSLYLMQGMVKRTFGNWAGWLFIAAVAGLTGFGVYVGRFMRFNSWDLLFRPVDVFHGIGRWIANPSTHPTSLTFPLLFAIFLFISYLMLYALTHLQHIQPVGQPALKLNQA